MNKKFLPAFVLAALFSMALFSCTKQNDDKYKGDFSKAYFPLQFGRYVTYNVDSTLWNDFLQVKSIHSYQMRYTVADTFRDNENRLSYRIDVHIRSNDTLPWQVHRVIYVTQTPTTLEYQEDNVRYIKLVYPISNNVQWKGNSLIPSDDQDYQYLNDWTYQYTDFGASYNDGNVYFDNTVTVLEDDELHNDPETMPSAYADKTYSKEVYGYDVGMVYREMTHWIYDPGVATFRKGYSVVMRAVDHN